MRDKRSFTFKQFEIYHHQSTMKVGTDGVLLGAWVNVANATRILDVGTGTGLIALMLAQRTAPEVFLEGIEISEPDFLQARENVSHSAWVDKIQLHAISLQQFESEPFDLIVCNPPYFKESYKPTGLLRTQARHTITLSEQDLLVHSKRLLRSSGALNVILPDSEGREFIEQAVIAGWHCSRICAFQSRSEKPIERLLLEFRLSPIPVKNEKLVLYKEGKGDEWSDAYRELTRDFYLRS